MRSYVIVTGDFVLTGGMDQANYALARRLASRGDAVHLVAHRVAEDLLAHPNVTFHRVPRPLGSHLFGAKPLDYIGRIVARRGAAAGARVIVNGGNCLHGDVNWVHYVHAAFSSALEGSAIARIRHGIARTMAVRDERAAVRQARLVIANSHQTRRDVIWWHGVEEARVRTVYYGTDPERFPPSTAEARRAARLTAGLPLDRPLVLFVGALSDRRKGLDTLMTAWGTLCATPGWDAVLVVVGEGGELRAWAGKTAADATLGERVRFLGFRSDVPTLVAACDASVSPSRYEPYGLAAQEALCAGLPAFVTARAGVAERYPSGSESLILPDPEDASGLADRLRAWRADLEGYRTLATRLFQPFRDHSWDDMADEIADAMDEHEAPARRTGP